MKPPHKEILCLDCQCYVVLRFCSRVGVCLISLLHLTTSAAKKASSMASPVLHGEVRAQADI